jgi:membrane protein implicated in regulation of membrane protease activity
MNKLFVAFGLYALLAALAWTTLSDPKFKFATLAILAMFALRTWSWSKKLEQEQREHRDE